MKLDRTPDQVRVTLERLRTERKVSFAALSRMIQRNEGYLQQFVSRGTPEHLAEDDRRLLAMFFNIDERELGARDPWKPPSTEKGRARVLPPARP